MAKARQQGWIPSTAGILEALQGELLMPLRSLNECNLSRTFGGSPIPAAPLEAAVDEMTRHVVEGTYRSWRYSNETAQVQLAGLSDEQKAQWAGDDLMEHTLTTGEQVTTHVGDGPELFWATKVGGPSHGFDYEGQCLLPLVCNGRHKVMLLTDPRYPHNPVGRAHFRMLYMAPKRTPILWLEGVHLDSNAYGTCGSSSGEYAALITKHAMRKAEQMGLRLSLETYGCAEQVVPADKLSEVDSKIILTPSKGVVEASDYLGDHDWPQMEEEETRRISRLLFTPDSAGAE